MNVSIAPVNGISTFKKGLAVTKNFVIKQSPIILACTAVGGVITTGLLAYQAGLKVDKVLKEEDDKKLTDIGEHLTTKEKVQKSWKIFVPTAVSATLTIGAIIASTTISQKRQTALAGLYALSETALKEYQDKVEKELGPKKAQFIQDEINSDKTRNSVPPWDDKILPQGEVLCYDKMCGRYFTSSVDKMKMAEASINSTIYCGDMCASLNELYSLIDSKELEECELGREVGWNVDRPCKLYFTSSLTSDMRPCLVMDFMHGNGPTPSYRDI